MPPSSKHSMVDQLDGIETEISHNLRTCGDSCTEELILLDFLKQGEIHGANTVSEIFSLRNIIVLTSWIISFFRSGEIYGNSLNLHYSNYLFS